MNHFQFFEDTQGSFRRRDDFQNAYRELSDIIKSSNITRGKKALASHRNTYVRLQQSFYHLEVLNHLKSNLGKENSELIYMHYYEQLICSLCNAINGLAYEIDTIYNLKSDKMELNIGEVAERLPEGPLSDLLKRKILDYKNDHWYHTRLRKERNKIVHGLTKLLQAEISGRIDLEKGRVDRDMVVEGMEVSQNSTFCYQKTESFIIDAYRHLKGKMIGKPIVHREDIKGELLSSMKCPYCGSLVAWREKRTFENWPTQTEREKYELPPVYQKQITARSLSPISILRSSENLTEEEVHNSFIDLEDTVCILEKMPMNTCPECRSEILIGGSLRECVEKLLVDGKTDVGTEIIKNMLSEYDFYPDIEENHSILEHVLQMRIRKFRYYITGKDKEDLKEYKERHDRRSKRKVTREIIDTYKKETIYRRKFGTLIDDFSRYSRSKLLNKNIQEYEQPCESERQALFFKDRNKAISLLKRIVADYHYNLEEYSRSKALYRESLEYGHSNGKSWLGLGCIDILQGEEKEGISKCLKAGGIDKKHYFDRIGWIFYGKGEIGKAEEWLKKSFDDKGSAEVAYYLGAIFFEEGRINESIPWLNLSIQLDSEHWDSYILSGRIYDKLERTPEGIDILQKAMQKIIDGDEEGKCFYKDEEKATKIHSLLRKLMKKGSSEQPIPP